MQVARNHPALPGHFPGHPIVPGVVLLDCVADEWRHRNSGSGRVTGISSAKFLAPLGPAQEFEVDIQDKAPGRFAFRVVSGDAVVATGTMTFEANR